MAAACSRFVAACRTGVACAPLLLTLLTGVGCRGAAANAAAEQEHEHEHELLPESLPAAIAELERLQAKLLDARQMTAVPSDATHELTHAIEELLEVLPELAVDSELPKDQWLLLRGGVQRWSEALEALEALEAREAATPTRAVASAEVAAVEQRSREAAQATLALLRDQAALAEASPLRDGP